MSKTLNVFLALIMLFSTGVLADVISLTNGDRITGNIIEFDGQALKIETSAAGILSIEKQSIKTFSTEQPKEWLVNDVSNTVNIQAADIDGDIAIDGKQINLQNLRLKNVAPQKLLSGNVELSVDIERDNDRKKEINFKAEAHYQLQKWRHEMEAEVKRGEQHSVLNEDVLEVNYNPDFLLNPHWLISTHSTYREEGVDMVSRYFHIGVGPGYRFWGDDRDQLDFKLTADKIIIKYGRLDLQLNAISTVINYRQFWFNDRIESYMDYSIAYPDWSGIDFIINSTVGIRYSFTQSVYLSVKYDFNETRYLLGSLKERETYLVLGLKF